MPGRGQFQSLTGETFGRLTVLDKVERRRIQTKKKRFRTYWLCKCECGQEHWVSRDSLLFGKTISCGCYSKEIRQRPKGDAAKRKLYSRYRCDAKRRKHTFDITEDEFIKIALSPCTYCGREGVSYLHPKRCNGGIRYNGVDRIDSSKGYTSDNCQPCCVDCNMAKWELTHGQFIKQIKMRYKWVTQNSIAI